MQAPDGGPALGPPPPASLPALRRIPSPDVTPRALALVAPLPFRRPAIAVVAAARRRHTAAARLAPACRRHTAAARLAAVVAAVAAPRLLRVAVVVVYLLPKPARCPSFLSCRLTEYGFFLHALTLRLKSAEKRRPRMAAVAAARLRKDTAKVAPDILGAVRNDKLGTVSAPGIQQRGAPNIMRRAMRLDMTMEEAAVFTQKVWRGFHLRSQKDQLNLSQRLHLGYELHVLDRRQKRKSLFLGFVKHIFYSAPCHSDHLYFYAFSSRPQTVSACLAPQWACSLPCSSCSTATV